MKNDRLRIPIDDPYLYAVGLAVICFSRLEWSAVWCCEKIQPAYLQSVTTKTAGTIANDLISISAAHSDPAIAASLGTQAAEFKRLVGRRNDLVHANPATAQNGEQRLFRHGTEWTLPMLEDVADDFAAADIQLNHHLHHLL